MHASLRSSLHLALAGTSLLTLATVAAAQDPAATAGNATVLEDIVVDGGSGGVITADGYVGKSSATGAKIGASSCWPRCCWPPCRRWGPVTPRSTPAGSCRCSSSRSRCSRGAGAGC